MSTELRHPPEARSGFTICVGPGGRFDAHPQSDRISADTALRLARYFATSERFWLNLQGRYDLEVERDRLAPTLQGIQPLVRA
jgi:hypothetical protein